MTEILTRFHRWSISYFVCLFKIYSNIKLWFGTPTINRIFTFDLMHVVSPWQLVRFDRALDINFFFNSQVRCWKRNAVIVSRCMYYMTALWGQTGGVLHADIPGLPSRRVNWVLAGVVRGALLWSFLSPPQHVRSTKVRTSRNQLWNME